jgi:hypothetical protein
VLWGRLDAGAGRQPLCRDLVHAWRPSKKSSSMHEPLQQLCNCKLICMHDLINTKRHGRRVLIAPWARAQ